jgi:DNA-binding response OmpR family regulator
VEAKILVACQDEGCQKILGELSKSQKLTFSAVFDDAELLLAIIEHDYQALIYDLDFSVLDSLKMVRILRKLRPKISLIVISDDPSKELGGKVLQEGVAYYGIKPIYEQAFCNVLCNVLS